MYKVFFNENQIFLSNKEISKIENIFYINNKSIEKLIAEISEGRNKKINIFHDNLELLWDDFCSYFKIIIAGGGIIKNPENQILFIFRNKKWDLPKGKIEENEQIEIGSLREVHEECGISNVKIESFLKKTYHIYILNNQYILKETHWFNMFYDSNEVLVPQIEEGIEKVEWKNKNDFPEIYKNTYSNILELINHL